MLLLSFLSLLFVGFVLTSVPVEAVVYYVTPTKPPNSDCPGEPCQTLDYYFSHGDKYFSSDKINVTMILLHGKHKLSYRPWVKDLETFEMIGMEPAHDVVVYVYSILRLEKIRTTCLGTLMFTKQGDYSQCTLIDESVFVKQASETPVFKDMVMSLTINGTIFNGVGLDIFLQRMVNFNIVMVNSYFINRSDMFFYPAFGPNIEYDIRQWNMTACMFSNSSWSLPYFWLNFITDACNIYEH